jgi:hypothetical protein
MTLWRRPAGDFSALDSRLGRPSIRPEKLFAREARASVLFDPLGAAVDGAAGVRSFCFAGLSGSASTSGVGSLAFSKNRDRLLEGDIAAKLLSLGSGAPRVKRLLSMDHFSVDGTLIEAWASMKSFKPKEGTNEPPADGGGRNRETDFHGREAIERHARLDHRSGGQALSQGVGQGGEALLHCIALMENRNGRDCQESLCAGS